MATQLTRSGAAAARRRAARQVIDVDVHEMLGSIRDLLPYLAAPWARLVRESRWRGPLTSYHVSVRGVERRDAKLESGAPAGSSYEVLREQLLDRYDLSLGILTGLFHVGQMRAQFELATAVAAAYNDWLIDTWLDRDPRFLGSVHVASQDPRAAAYEIDRVGGHPKMVQVMLHVSDEPYGDPFYRPIFEAAARNGLHVAMHPTGDTSGALGRAHYQIEWHSNYSQAFMGEVVSLIYNGVLDSFPDLKILLLEGGFSWLPHVMWRMDEDYRSMREEVPWVKRLPGDYIRERIRLGTQPIGHIEARHLVALTDMLGSDRCFLFASDYPHWDFDDPERALPAGLPEDLRRRILYENARDLYGLGAEG
jgi:predicted TIM-barrel fold metal-dependent hydrolase